MASANAARRGKFKIKAPQKHGPDISIEQTWSQLANNIREIQNHNASNLSFEENHRFAYNMVLYKKGEQLYDGVNQLVAENLDKLASEEVIPVFPSTGSDILQQSQEGEILLKALRSIWDDHLGNMLKLSQILKYMDRVYTLAAHVPEIRDAGLDLFLKHIIRPPIDKHLVSAILTQIQVEREGHVINRSAVKGCVDVFLSLKGEKEGTSMYTQLLEPAVLRESGAYFKAEGQRLLDSWGTPEYLRWVEGRFESEESRTHHYLSAQTSSPLQEILKKNLLTAHLSGIIAKANSGLDAMIDSNKIDDLSRLYRLYLMVPEGLPCLRKSLKDSIERRGANINRTSSGMEIDEVDGGVVDIDDTADHSKNQVKSRPNTTTQTLALALQWVQDVLDLKDLFDHVWRQAFSRDKDLDSAINTAFEFFVNVNEKSPEFISLFIDENLKKGLKGKTDTEVDIVLDKTITIFRYLAEKDAFERYYKGHLAKRLLLGRSVSEDAERGMLAKLKVESGYQFTQKLEGMFNDMKLSSETMQAYRKHLASTTAPDIELSVVVMTSTYWPMSHAVTSCNFPEEMVKASKSFERFYLSIHSGRRLTWQPSLGNADVRVSFKARKHDLNVSTLALVILLLFEDVGDDEFLTYEEIKSATSIADVELKRHLQSLACTKFKILKKHPPGRGVEPDDSFSFNQNFSSPLQKIKISTVAAKVETNEERKETRDRIEDERRHQTEACIVRIMKDRKHLTHNALVDEVTRQLASRFHPNPLNIKKQIEGLIDREYLSRCEDRKSYDYVA